MHLIVAHKFVFVGTSDCAKLHKQVIHISKLKIIF